MEAFFLDAQNGQRFCLFHAPPNGTATRGGLLYIHPFAEEMNRSRKMAALQARAFANAGYAVMQIDLDGCGDSSGEFANASWESWLSDVTMAWHWLAARVNAPLWLWGLRGGCFLAVECAANLPEWPANFLFWQPVLSGRQHLNQFLRLKFASDLVRGGTGGGSESLLKELTEGRVIEVAGYEITPSLAGGLANADLAGISASARIKCFELSGSAGGRFSPALAAQVKRWQASGCEVTGVGIEGPPFWQSIETQTSTPLIQASLAAVSQGLN